MDQDTFNQRFELFTTSGITNLPSQFELSSLEVQPGRAEMPVIVLVHGIGGEARHWSDPAGLNPANTWLFNTRAKPDPSKPGLALSPAYKPTEVQSWCKALHDSGMSYINYSQKAGQLVEDAAKDLGLLLKALEDTLYQSAGQQAPLPPLIILCHSRGGLVTRLALKGLSPKDLPHLTKVISLCTPHLGSYMPKLASDIKAGTLTLDFSGLKDTALGQLITSGLSPEDARSCLNDLALKLEHYLPGVLGGAGSGPDFEELIPDSPLLKDILSNDNPWPGVTYHGFGGSNPTFVIAYANLALFQPKLLSISSPELIGLLNELRLLPDLKAAYNGLAELDSGDSSVAPLSSQWPARFNADHYFFPVNHMEALINQDLQSAVLDLILGKDFSKVVATAAIQSQTRASSDWLNDPAVSAIHDAFLLGWTNIELKSRVRLATLDQLIVSSCTFTEQAPPQTSSNIFNWLQDEVRKILSSIPLVSQTSATPATTVNGRPQNLPEQDATAAGPASGALSTEPAVEKGSPSPGLAGSGALSVSSSQSASGLPASDLEASTNSNLILPNPGSSDSTQLTSLWRSLFCRLSELHYKRFPTNNTADTAYDYNLKAQHQPWSFLDEVSPEIANFGVAAFGPVKDPPNKIPLADFSLYELSRQTLNCLSLLFTDDNQSLIATTLTDYQRRLLLTILASSDQPNKWELSKANWNYAIQKLGELFTNLMEAWDGYLREQYFSGGEFKNDVIELVAYEAGRSLALLSWETSVRVEPLERLLEGLQDKDLRKRGQTYLYVKHLKDPEHNPLKQFDPVQNSVDAPTLQDFKEDLETQIKGNWVEIFNKSTLTRLQHQIAALSTTLDEAFYRLNPNIKKPESDVLEQPNPDTPSQAIHAIRHSLDYWQRTIELIGTRSAKEPVQTANDPARSAAAQPPRTLILDGETTWPGELRASLIKQSNVWQSLLSGEQNLRSFSAESVTDRIIADLMDDLKEAMEKGIRRDWPWLIGLGIVMVVVLGLVGAAIWFSNNNSTLGVIATLGTLLGGAALFKTGNSGLPASAGSGSLQKPAELLVITGNSLVEAFQNGFQQIRIEFSYLNYNISVAYPLIEFFILNEIKISQGEQPVAPTRSRPKREKRDKYNNVFIQNGYQFLVNVIWTNQDRDEEIKRVARAAFGPVGAFIGAHIDNSPNPKNQAG